MSRPGGVMWPQLPSSQLRIVLSYTKLTTTRRGQISPRLKVNWVPSKVDLSHSTLTASANRDYVSNGYGMQRKDFSL